MGAAVGDDDLVEAPEAGEGQRLDVEDDEGGRGEPDSPGHGVTGEHVPASAAAPVDDELLEVEHGGDLRAISTVRIYQRPGRDVLLVISDNSV